MRGTIDGLIDDDGQRLKRFDFQFLGIHLGGTVAVLRLPIFEKLVERCRTGLGYEENRRGTDESAM